MASAPGAADGFRTADDDNQAATNEWVRFGMRLAISSALHPFEYAKVLIQLGYEPVAPVPGVSFFGRPIQKLPNIFQYAGYIRRADGFFGCYRGLTPKLMGSVVSLLGSEKIADYFGLTSYEESNKDTDEDLYGGCKITRFVTKTVFTLWFIFTLNLLPVAPLFMYVWIDSRRKWFPNTLQSYIQFKINLKRDVVLTASGVIISHPFHVISLRMMSQFIGRETLYKSLISSIVEIYKNEGLEGFFAGLMPKLMCDLACVILTSSTVFLLNKYLIKDKIGRQYNAGFTQFAFTSILYPLQVVSTCMTVTGSRLMAGRPPIMPEYKNWIDCWNDLQARGELKRGSSLFWRSVPSPPKHRISEYPPLPTLAKYY